MGSTPILDDAVREAQDVLWEALPPGSSRELAVVKLRALLGSPKITAALAAASDNVIAFAIRESRVHLAERPARPDKTISALWEILDDRGLNQAVGIPQNPGVKFHPSRTHRWR